VGALRGLDGSRNLSSCWLGKISTCQY
jgi:hypothetical protein